MKKFILITFVVLFMLMGRDLFAFPTGIFDAVLDTNSDYYQNLMLNSSIVFDYWFELNGNLEGYNDGFNFDIMVLMATKNWDLLKRIECNNISTEWQKTIIDVPEELQGSETEIRFTLADYNTNQAEPIVYLRNIESPVPIPEPNKIFLFIIGFLSLIIYRFLLNNKIFKF